MDFAGMLSLLRKATWLQRVVPARATPTVSLMPYVGLTYLPPPFAGTLELKLT